MMLMECCNFFPWTIDYDYNMTFGEYGMEDSKIKDACKASSLYSTAVLGYIKVKQTLDYLFKLWK